MQLTGSCIKYAKFAAIFRLVYGLNLKFWIIYDRDINNERIWLRLTCVKKQIDCLALSDTVLLFQYVMFSTLILTRKVGANPPVSDSLLIYYENRLVKRCSVRASWDHFVYSFCICCIWFLSCINVHWALSRSRCNKGFCIALFTLGVKKLQDVFWENYVESFFTHNLNWTYDEVNSVLFRFF